ncbi:MAG: hypothetical protein SGI84_11700 [Gemmatimonadota bacterium]|nr:hypothetical protein [Gemmatimonadota bacterium]
MTTPENEQRELSAALARLNARAWGIALGLLGGGGLFLATMILLIKGGQNVGQHLSLLRAYFPGYSVTILGSFIGFIYGFVVGYALGRIIGLVYNRLATPPRRTDAAAR